ncbi:MAG: DNA primase [Desulfovibrionaceae bacterium]
MSSQAIQLLKSRLNIADVIRRYVDLKPVSGRWMGVCPFHQETKPSMSVNEQEGFFYCFGCQASGDVIDFYKRINGIEFTEALEQLAREAGVDLGDMRPDPQAEDRRKKKRLFFDMHTWAAEHFRFNLERPVGSVAREYLQRRGTSADIIKEFGLGYALDEWHALDEFLQSKGFTVEQGADSGLLSSNQKGSIYDRFRARLIFPIQDLSGQVIAFGGRIITEGEPKYLNSSDSPIYKKGEHLYGLYQARKVMTRSRRALLTEGYMDVLSLHQFGYQDSCGVLGTALTADQVRRLAGFCNRVDLVFDGDPPGRKAALRSAEMILLQGLRVNVVLMPEGEDVDSLLQAHGRDGMESCLATAADGLSFAMQTLQREHSPKEIMDWAQSFLQKLQDASLKAYYLPRLAQGLGLSEAELRSGARHQAPRVEVPKLRPATAVGREDKDDEYFLGFPIQYPDYVPSLQEKGFVGILATDWAKQLWNKLVQYHGQDPLPHLDDQEKRFWVKKRVDMGQSFALSGEELLDEWNHICKRIEDDRDKNRRRELIEALKHAQEQGDDVAVAEYTMALNESLGEK